MENNQNPNPNPEEFIGMTHFLNSLGAPGIYYGKTPSEEDLVIYYVPDGETRVVVFREDHSVLEILYNKQNEPFAYRDGGTWEIEERPEEEVDSDEE